MAYIPSPLKSFNKNNQFIIIAKNQYYKSVDDLQGLTKSNIRYLIRNGAALLVVLLLQIISTIIGTSYVGFGWAMFVFFLFGHLALVYILVRCVRYYSIDHPAIKEFTHLSNMEIAEIASTNVQHEDILFCLHKQYLLEGELLRDTKWLKISYLVLLGLLILDACVIIIFIFV